MKKAKTRMQKQPQWRRHAVNLETNKEIQVARVNPEDPKSDFVYRIDGSGRTYMRFKDAVVETYPYRNARRSLIAVEVFFRSAKPTPYFLYSPNGTLVGKYVTVQKLSAAFKHAEKRFPSASDEDYEKRKEAYLAIQEKRIEDKKRAMIEREKKRILQERAKVERQRQFEKEHGNVVGSW